MSHAFKAHPKHPAVDYLVRLHADIGGRIKANKEEADGLADDMRHVEAVLKMFDPTFSVRAISARRRTFLLACLAALELDGVALEDI